MKLGASATSPGVTARWIVARWRMPAGCSTETATLRVGEKALGAVQSEFWEIATIGRRRWYAWMLATGRIGRFAHRYQAKRAVEAAVAQALREAEQ